MDKPAWSYEDCERTPCLQMLLCLSTHLPGHILLITCGHDVQCLQMSMALQFGDKTLQYTDDAAAQLGARGGII